MCLFEPLKLKLKCQMKTCDSAPNFCQYLKEIFIKYSFELDRQKSVSKKWFLKRLNNVQLLEFKMKKTKIQFFFERHSNEGNLEHLKKHDQKNLGVNLISTLYFFAIHAFWYVSLLKLKKFLLIFFFFLKYFILSYS